MLNRARKPKKNLKKQAALLSSLGASAGGRARAESHTPRQLSMMARHAAQVRHSKSK